MNSRLFSTEHLENIEILCCCPVGSVLPHGEGDGASLASVGHPSSDGVISSFLIGLVKTELLDQLKLT